MLMNVLCLQALSQVYNIFAGGSADSSKLTAIVKKSSSSKLVITLDQQAHIKYEAEGSFSEFVYSIHRSGKRVAQVCLPP